MNQADREKMLNAFADPAGSDSMEFSIKRTENDNLSFSPEVLDDFRDQCFLFIGGRICAFHDRENKPARKLKVRIEVTVEN